MSRIEPEFLVGSTFVVGPEELPTSLSPIGLQGGDDYLLPRHDDRTRLVAWEPVSADWFREQLEEERAIAFSEAIPFRRDHVLIQLEADSAPEYIAASQVDERLRQACDAALDRAEALLAATREQQAHHEIWYAARASRGDPIPWLLVVTISREEAASSDDAAAGLEELIELYETDTKSQRPAELLAALRQLKDRRPHLFEVLRSEPLVRRAVKAAELPATVRRPPSRPFFVRPTARAA